MVATPTRLAWALTACATLYACGGSSPAAPAATNVAGVWIGDLATALGALRVNWTLAQSGVNVTGPIVVAQSGFPVIRGALTGTISGSTLTYRINIPAGGVATNPSCTGQIDGTMTLSNAAQMTGRFTGTSTCDVPISGGDLTLQKQ
jgi:hypothetical protein